MKIEKYTSNALKIILKRKKVCTLDDLLISLGTKVKKTVFRKLAELKYQTSYSHYGKYYTLKSSCRFNESGLWVYGEVYFSIYGTLVETAKNLVTKSTSGFSVTELNHLLQVSTKQALFNLEKKELLCREKVDGCFVYFSSDEKVRHKQVLARGSGSMGDGKVLVPDLLAHELKALIILFFSLLNEQQRRLFAGIEALKIGNGGDIKIAEFLGIDPHTVAKGRQELLGGDLDTARLRRPGGGRKRQEKKVQK